MATLKKITRTVLSYCEIPEDIVNESNLFSEVTTNTYVEVRITPFDEQIEYDDVFQFENWVIKEHPELEGQTILVHIDY